MMLRSPAGFGGTRRISCSYSILSSSCLLLVLLLFFNNNSHYYHHVDAFVIPKGQKTRNSKRVIALTGQQQQQSAPFFLQASTSSSVSTTPVSSNIKSQSKQQKWSNFDYEQHWYPVSWICDLRHNEITKITLFDVDYVVAVDKSKSEDDDKNVKITALRDRCPHRSAALSEGRITSNGAIQCAYHGWSFNGTTGACLEIPQSSTSSSTSTSSSFSSRTCATAIPAMAHQGMLWLWPGPPRQTANDYPMPPTIPELNLPGYKTVRVVRDFPQVDWTLLLSNILDPDHGLFAHQAGPFDWYSASPDQPLTVEETFDNNGHGWTMFSAVPAVEKLLKVDKEKRSNANKNKSSSSSSSSSKTKTTATKQYMATSTFYAPTAVILCRRPTISGDSTNIVNRTANPTFLTAFWVCPVGTGKSRFFSCSCSKMPFTLPRWFFHYNLNNFLDQDTVLVASQQPATLMAEALGQGRSSTTTITTTATTASATTSLYAYASPTDKAVRLLDSFWDSTTARAPNRQQTLQEMLFAGKLRHVDATRSIILDRKTQHLDLCPDSQDTVRNAKRIRNICCLASVWLLLVSSLVLPPPTISSITASYTTAATAAATVAGGGGLNGVVTFVLGAAIAITVKIKPKYRIMLFLLSTVVAWSSHKLQRGFYYNYPEWKRNRDLKNIPVKTWMDP